MRISDWSSDVCSSELIPHALIGVVMRIVEPEFLLAPPRPVIIRRAVKRLAHTLEPVARQRALDHAKPMGLDAACRLRQIARWLGPSGRASCRGMVGMDV